MLHLSLKDIINYQSTSLTITDCPTQGQGDLSILNDQGHSYHVFVRQTVLGEITAKILEKSRADELSDRLRRYHSIFSDYGIDHFCLPGINKRVPRYISDLQAIDDQLDPNDTLIISQVLTDPDSKFFFTQIQRCVATQRS